MVVVTLRGAKGAARAALPLAGGTRVYCCCCLSASRSSATSRGNTPEPHKCHNHSVRMWWWHSENASHCSKLMQWCIMISSRTLWMQFPPPLQGQCSLQAFPHESNFPPTHPYLSPTHPPTHLSTHPRTHRC